MENIDFSGKVEHILTYDRQYPVAAYEFLNTAVKYTIDRIADAAPRRHIGARELLDGMVAYACEAYGPLAAEVLDSWRVYTAQDVGNMVYNLVREKLFSTNENDSPQDFELAYDLRARLLAPFRQEPEAAVPKAPIIA
ncbi:MAG: hypothetical protein PHQ27_10235 [Victivallales bacterium]|nr:hypothetical protein [Victivallales bacterium]